MKVFRGCCFFWIFCLAVGPCRPQDAAAIPNEGIRVDVNVVTLQFTVKALDGAPMNHLRKEQFKVFENGIAQEVAFFEEPRNQQGELRRLRLAFLLDISGSTFATRAEEILAAQTFFENIHRFTEVGVFGFTDKLIPLQDFTSNRNSALRAFSSAQRHLGKTAIYDCLDDLLSQINRRRDKKVESVVIVISDGMDENYSKAAKSIARARSNKVVLHTILVPSAAQLYISPESAKMRANNSSSWPARNKEEEKKRAFAQLSLQTNGKHFGGFQAILDFDQVMAQISDDLFGNLYLIGYHTDDPYKDKLQRNIRVEINRTDAKVTTPFKNLPERRSAKKAFLAALFNNEEIGPLPRSFSSTFHEVGAELDLLTARKEGGEVGAPFRIKINSLGLKTSTKGNVRTQFGVIGLLVDKRGREVVRLREIFRVSLDAKAIRNGRGIVYTNKLFAPPGSYTLKLALVEIPTWKMTVFDRAVKISAP